MSTELLFADHGVPPMPFRSDVESGLTRESIRTRDSADNPAFDRDYDDDDEDEDDHFARGQGQASAMGSPNDTGAAAGPATERGFDFRRHSPQYQFASSTSNDNDGARPAHSAYLATSISSLSSAPSTDVAHSLNLAAATEQEHRYRRSLDVNRRGNNNDDNRADSKMDDHDNNERNSSKTSLYRHSADVAKPLRTKPAPGAHPTRVRPPIEIESNVASLVNAIEQLSSVVSGASSRTNNSSARSSHRHHSNNAYTHLRSDPSPSTTSTAVGLTSHSTRSWQSSGSSSSTQSESAATSVPAQYNPNLHNHDGASKSLSTEQANNTNQANTGPYHRKSGDSGVIFPDSTRPANEGTASHPRSRQDMPGEATSETWPDSPQTDAQPLLHDDISEYDGNTVQDTSKSERSWSPLHYETNRRHVAGEYGTGPESAPRGNPSNMQQSTAQEQPRQQQQQQQQQRQGTAPEYSTPTKISSDDQDEIDTNPSPIRGPRWTDDEGFYPLLPDQLVPSDFRFNHAGYADPTRNTAATGFADNSNNNSAGQGDIPQYPPYDASLHRAISTAASSRSLGSSSRQRDEQYMYDAQQAAEVDGFSSSERGSTGNSELHDNRLGRNLEKLQNKDIITLMDAVSHALISLCQSVSS